MMISIYLEQQHDTLFLYWPKEKKLEMIQKFKPDIVRIMYEYILLSNSRILLVRIML